MNVPSHPNKDIKKAIDHAIANNWSFKKLGLGGHSHPWGQITCPAKINGIVYTEWCKVIIYGTPKYPDFIAKGILKKVQKCNH